MFKRATICEILHQAGRTKTVIADRRNDAGRACVLAHQASVWIAEDGAVMHAAGTGRVNGCGKGLPRRLRGERGAFTHAEVSASTRFSFRRPFNMGEIAGAVDNANDLYAVFH
jgi:hypothetical protein